MKAKSNTGEMDKSDKFKIKKGVSAAEEEEIYASGKTMDEKINDIMGVNDDK